MPADYMVVVFKLLLCMEILSITLKIRKHLRHFRQAKPNSRLKIPED
jgi:hypothetical protein